jgi:hypothetical protein
MDALVEAALISAGATLVGVGGTVAVAIFGLRNSSTTSRVAIESATANLQQTLETEREGQITDRYSRAAEQLGSDKLDIRIAGIFALDRIAHDSARDHPIVIEVLAAFIRQHSREQWPLPDSEDAPVPEHRTRPDVQAALTVIGRRDARRDRQRVDLMGANLSGADLTSANLAHARLTGVSLISAKLKGANLGEANLTDADLTHADLRVAILAKADLGGADFDDADLQFADLTGVVLLELDAMPPGKAKLDGAKLRGAAWSLDSAVPKGWQREAKSGRLEPAEPASGTVPH